jgi:LCP family protein required for cell wall assembly
LKYLKAFIISILIFVATIGGAALKVYEILDINHIDENGDGQNSIVSGDVPIVAQPGSGRLKTDPLLGTTNVLLVGLDDFEAVLRSDAIAIAFFNLKEDVLGVLSIPRDSRVQIPGHGWDKINHAYAFGGVNLLKRTLENLTNVTINYSVVFNFDSFPRMIDLIGGVDIYVDKPMRYTDYSQKLFINIPSGQQHMNGKRALEYVRFRHDPLGDIGRLQRQQKFMSAVLEKVKTPLVIPQIPGLVREVVSAINTDLTPIEAIRLATYVSTLKQGRVNFAMAPGKASYIGNISYWTISSVEQSVLITKLIAGENDFEREASAEEFPTELTDEATLDLVARIGKIGILNGDGAAGLAKRASQVFQKIGIDVPYTGDARHFGYVSSNVVYPSEQHRLAAEALAQLCGITNKALVRRDASARMVSIILGHDKETIFRRLNDAESKP